MHSTKTKNIIKTVKVELWMNEMTGGKVIKFIPVSPDGMIKIVARTDRR